MPILDETKKAVGIISIDDLIIAPDENCITEKIKDHMFKDVITIFQKHSLISAIKKYKYGWLPITENEHSPKIVGITYYGRYFIIIY